MADADPGVKAEMDKTGLKYAVDSDDDIRVSFDSTWGGNDVHVYVDKAVETLAGLKVRDVWAEGVRMDKIPAELKRIAAESNGEYKIGAWQLHTNGGRERLIFRYPVDADADAGVLEDVIQAIGSTVDGFREENRRFTEETPRTPAGRNRL